MTESEVIQRPDKGRLAAALADRLVDEVVAAQRARGVAHLVLTGGSMGTALLEALGAGGRLDEVDWSAVELWWGDERFVPPDDPERNELQARQALLERLPLEPARLHPMAAHEDDELDAEAGAKAYGSQLASAADDGASPTFDVLMLGVGPDAHVASLFPGHAALDELDASVVAVHDSPKPPPDRITMTFATLASSRQVWFMVAGADKAEAVARVREGAELHDAPAAGVAGRERTVWWLDDAAASRLP